MQKKRKKLTSTLALCLLSGIILGGQNVYAEEGYSPDIQQEAAAITDEPESREADNAEEYPALPNQQDNKENSWRYRDGEAISVEPYTSARAYPQAWEKVDGVYMNSVGEPIEGAVKKGIDVSEHQGRINWDKVKNDGIDFAIIRCGYGNDSPRQDDKQWLNNVAECERLGIPYGVYIYSYATDVNMARSEAEHVLRLINGRSFEYPVYFDMEDDSTANLSSDLKGQIAKTFCDTVSAAGYKVGIYANLNWWNTQLTSQVFQNDTWSKWIAQYNVTCDYDSPYDIWQCTSSGKVDGISGGVDLNFQMETMNAGGNGPGDGAPTPEPDPDPAPKPEPTTSGSTLAVRRGNEYHIKYTLSNGAADLVFNYGYANDQILVGDWNGDGIDTICVRRGNAYYFKDSLLSGEADKIVYYGKRDDVVLAGDWDGDGKDTLCVRRNNVYHIKNSLSDGAADKVVAYGRAKDSVLIGDWDGDGSDTICVRRGNTYYFKNSLSDGEADSTIKYGWAADTILVGDWNNNGSDTLCVRRGNAYHIKNSIDAGAADQIVLYGKAHDTIYAGKWK